MRQLFCDEPFPTDAFLPLLRRASPWSSSLDDATSRRPPPRRAHPAQPAKSHIRPPSRARALARSPHPICSVPKASSPGPDALLLRARPQAQPAPHDRPPPGRRTRRGRLARAPHPTPPSRPSQLLTRPPSAPGLPGGGKLQSSRSKKKLTALDLRRMQSSSVTRLSTAMPRDATSEDQWTYFDESKHGFTKELAESSPKVPRRVPLEAAAAFDRDARHV